MYTQDSKLKLGTYTHFSGLSSEHIHTRAEEIDDPARRSIQMSLGRESDLRETQIPQVEGDTRRLYQANPSLFCWNSSPPTPSSQNPWPSGGSGFTFSAWETRKSRRFPISIDSPMRINFLRIRSPVSDLPVYHRFYIYTYIHVYMPTTPMARRILIHV